LYLGLLQAIRTIKDRTAATFRERGVLVVLTIAIYRVTNNVGA
jgi:hypothetical protein